MRDLFGQLIRETHWPSWLRGASVTLFVWSLAGHMIDAAIIGLLLYAVSQWLLRYFPYTCK